MNIEEWGTPVSRDKIIYRRNRLIEYQRVGELRFTPLYEAIDENILDINYMIYEIDRLNKVLDHLELYFSDREYYEFANLVRDTRKANIEWLEGGDNDT